MHTIREHARALFDFFADDESMGPALALICFGRVPPRPLVGRWGRTSACEVYLLLGGTGEDHKCRTWAEVERKCKNI